MLDIATDASIFADVHATFGHHRFDDRRANLFQPIMELRFYCRDTCPSMAPRRAARSFATAAEARRAGLQPCGWCRPDRPAAIAPHRAARASRTVAAVLRALVFLP